MKYLTGLFALVFFSFGVLATESENETIYVSEGNKGAWAYLETLDQAEMEKLRLERLGFANVACKPETQSPYGTYVRCTGVRTAEGLASYEENEISKALKEAAIREEPYMRNPRRSSLVSKVDSRHEVEIKCSNTEAEYFESDLSKEFKNNFFSEAKENSYRNLGFHFFFAGALCNITSPGSNGYVEVAFVMKRKKFLLRDHLIGSAGIQITLKKVTKEQLDQGLILAGTRESLINIDGNESGALSSSRVGSSDLVYVMIKSREDVDSSGFGEEHRQSVTIDVAMQNCEDQGKRLPTREEADEWKALRTAIKFPKNWIYGAEFWTSTKLKNERTGEYWNYYFMTSDNGEWATVGSMFEEGGSLKYKQNYICVPK